MSLSSENADLISVSAKVPAYWHEPHLWAWSENGENAFYSWPGGVMTQTENGYTLHAPAWVDHVIVNACDGYYKTEDIAVEKGKDVYLNIRDKQHYILSNEKMEDFPDSFSVYEPEYSDKVKTAEKPATAAAQNHFDKRLLAAGAAVISLALGLGLYVTVKKLKRH